MVNFAETATVSIIMSGAGPYFGEPDSREGLEGEARFFPGAVIPLTQQGARGRQGRHRHAVA